MNWNDLKKKSVELSGKAFTHAAVLTNDVSEIALKADVA